MLADIMGLMTVIAGLAPGLLTPTAVMKHPNPWPFLKRCFIITPVYMHAVYSSNASFAYACSVHSFIVQFHQHLATQSVLSRFSRFEMPQQVLSSSALTTAIGWCSLAAPYAWRSATLSTSGCFLSRSSSKASKRSSSAWHHHDW